jgi:hypothetical protein
MLLGLYRPAIQPIHSSEIFCWRTGMELSDIHSEARVPVASSCCYCPSSILVRDGEERDQSEIPNVMNNIHICHGSPYWQDPRE